MTISEDVLSVCLDALRLSGSLVLDHAYLAPWNVNIPDSAQLGEIVGVEPSARVIAFHYAERGEFSLSLDPSCAALGVKPVSVGPGELVVCFGGDAHTIGRGTGGRVVGIDAILKGEETPPLGDATPGATKLLCGVFVLHDALLNPLLAALPNVAHARLAASDLDGVIRTLQREIRICEDGYSFIIARTLEILCASLIREQLREDTRVGLFRVLRDPRLARALEGFHRAPAEAWTVESLAKLACLSRSRFSAHFTETAGEGPMAYVTRWRLNLATRMLRTSNFSVAEIAARVGYQSTPAFSRVYKRHLGVSPAQHQKSLRGEKVVESFS